MSNIKNTTTETVVHKVSKKSRATEIFTAKLLERSQGLFGSNKEFRRSTLSQIITELGVTTASAATMYNTAKEEAEAVNPNLGLGRDPKKEKPLSNGRRGRPAGSKNQEKKEIVAEPEMV